MFIRQVKKQRNPNSGIFYQYNLVQSARIEGKVRQRIILYLGSDELLASPSNRKTVLAILKSRIYGQQELYPENVAPELLALAERYYQKYLIKYPPNDPVSTLRSPSLPPDEKKAAYEQVDVSAVSCSESRTFGCEYLCTQILQKLGLADYLKKLEWEPDDRKLALISIAARAIFSASEYKTAQYLADNSDLCACLVYENESVSHKQLYRIADKLYEEKENLDAYLYDRINHMFNLEDKLVIFDLSNTYFEGRKEDSQLAQYGRSKEKRNDCKQVVFTGVINAEGFIRHSRIYEGNMSDSGSMEDMLEDLERHSKKGQNKTIVIDAGIATQENLDMIASKGYKYVCVARSKLQDYEAHLSGEKTIQLTDREQKQVALKIIRPAEGKDTWMYVKSDAKVLKEQSMDNKIRARFLQDMEQIERGIHLKGGTKTLARVWERIGRVKQKYPGIAKQYDINVAEQKPDEKTRQRKAATKAAGVTWRLKAPSAQDHGVYFIRTNYEHPEEKELWNIYNTIREVEATFRCLKSDLNIRPIYHQNDNRIKSHIYLTILAYQLVNTIRYMLKQKNIHYDWNNIVRIMNTHVIQTILLPTPSKTIHIRKPAQPGEKVISIYQATNTGKVMTPTVKYVVYH